LAVNGVDVEFIVGSAHDVPLPDESVDVVFGIAILHHLDLKLAARELRRVLRVVEMVKVAPALTQLGE
jgi:ubiquinone/menaquinone biosynthesis C-methylase UbiE